MILISKIDNINISELECRMDGMDVFFIQTGNLPQLASNIRFQKQSRFLVIGLDGIDINFPLRVLSELIALDEIDHVSNLYHSIWF